MKFITHVPHKVSEIVPDFLISATRCAFYLEESFHKSMPGYIWSRVDDLKGDFDLRVRYECNA